MEVQGILVNLTISDDKLEAYMDLIPGGGGPDKVDLAYLEAMLQAQEISQGIDSEALQKLSVAAKDNKRMDKVLVAKGVLPKKGAPAYIKLKKQLFSSKVLKDVNSDKVDFKMVSPFTMVKEGEPLGRRREETEGTPGKNVFGQEVPPAKKDITQIEAGENIKWEEDVAVAAISGRFDFDGKKFSVSDILEIEGDVDYSTGHISFAGNVIIHGEIKDGFRVAAGGSVHCKKTLDASEILCRKDLIVEGGIKGRNTGLVRVQGKVETKFIENCHLESYKGISVKSSVLDSEIFTLGEFILGDKKGTIIGGECYAEKGISAVNIGSSRNSHTNIVCGVSYILMRKHNHLEKRLEVLNEKIHTLKGLKQSPRNLELLEKAEKARETLQTGIANSMVEQYTDYKAEVKISGTIYPGAHITICDRQMQVSKEMSQVIIYYDKVNAQLAVKNFE